MIYATLGCTQAAELAATKNRLQFLNAQIDPHFLNNALSAISGVVEKSPHKAQDLLADLGDYFRTLCAETDAMVSVAGELEAIRRYVALEQARFGARLHVEYLVTQKVLALKIPRLVVQPLVENAIRHGVEKNPGPGVVRVFGDIEEGNLVFRVTDNGGGLMQPLQRSDYGIGLSNVDDRLQRLIGDQATLQITSEWGEGTTATLVLSTGSHAVPIVPAVLSSGLDTVQQSTDKQLVKANTST